MKAIILTYAPVNKQEAQLLKNTDIFKIATNFSAVELKPNLRLTEDNIVDKCLEVDTCPVVSLNYDLEKERVINACTMPKRHSSLLGCVDYLYVKGYTSVLLVASNPDSATCKINYEGINRMKSYLHLYKYTKEGNFDIPHRSIKEFLMLTDEDKLLGVTEDSPKKLLEKTRFTDACHYEVWTDGKDNKSIESGEIIKNILPLDMKEKLLNGAEEIKYNGLCIKVLTTLKVEEPKEEEITPKKTVKRKVKK